MHESGSQGSEESALLIRLIGDHGFCVHSVPPLDYPDSTDYRLDYCKPPPQGQAPQVRGGNMSTPRSGHSEKEKRERDWATCLASSLKPTNQTKQSSSHGGTKGRAHKFAFTSFSNEDWELLLLYVNKLPLVWGLILGSINVAMVPGSHDVFVRIHSIASQTQTDLSKIGK